MSDEVPGGCAVPYREPWTLTAARAFFTCPRGGPAVSVLREWQDGRVAWRELTFGVRDGLRGLATLAMPGGVGATRGVVLAHGGSDDGRSFFLSEAAGLARRGAAVILPAIRVRQDGQLDNFATDIRDAVLTERAALDVLTDSVGVPPEELSFLGHSGGGALGAVLAAVEPRLSRIGIFAYGAGTLPRGARARARELGVAFSAEQAATADWFDAARFVSTQRAARLLIQHGRTDNTVPIEEGRALFEAAATPKTWAEYDWDHGLDADPDARADRADFVAS